MKITSRADVSTELVLRASSESASCEANVNSLMIMSKLQSEDDIPAFAFPTITTRNTHGTQGNKLDEATEIERVEAEELGCSSMAMIPTSM